MSEAKSFRHTSGEWQKHPDYKFDPLAVVDDDGRSWVSCTVYISTAEKKIIGSATLHCGNGLSAGYPHVDNMIEMKANLALMSAAPKMLDGLVKIAELMKAMDSNKSEVLVIAEDLIAKATTY